MRSGAVVVRSKAPLPPSQSQPCASEVTKGTAPPLAPESLGPKKKALQMRLSRAVQKHVRVRGMGWALLVAQAHLLGPWHQWSTQS
mmetsp:Transcript_5832/g.14830  ORF Transcript_5832/g.14830 Transcript_5832/m.14830 type:complete len:86 (-) Transcript_5832:381-638(-)